MQHLTKAVLAGLILIVVAGCQPSVNITQEIRLVDIRGNALENDYPPVVSGYERGPVLAYEQGMENFSVTYKYDTAEAVMLATVYEYQKRETPRPFAQQFRSEQAAVVLRYPDAKLLSQKKTSFRHKGKSYKVHKATYSYSTDFFEKVEPVYAELWLIDRGTHWVKLRSTTPIANRALAAKKNRQLMNLVNWAD
jgi:hypothetical protein